jgi:uracil phosphoribosyltransferase
MLPAAMELLPDADIAVVGVQRDEETHQPSEYVAKLPSRLDGRHCIVLDPMLATGGSLEYGCKLLAARGAPQPIDERLNENAFIVPGLGDAGDRQFGPPH